MGIVFTCSPSRTSVTILLFCCTFLFWLSHVAGIDGKLAKDLTPIDFLKHSGITEH